MNEKDMLTEAEAIRMAVKSEGFRTIANKLQPLDVTGTEAITVLCSRWEDRSIRGCIKQRCASCNSEVALAPSSQAELPKYRGELRFICAQCYLAGKAKKDHG